MTDFIPLSSVLPGAIRFSDNNVSKTFRGQVLLPDSEYPSDAIIKDVPARELANELLSSLLARWVGLPTPRASLGLVRPGDMVVEDAPTDEAGNGFVFVSVDVKAPNITFRLNNDGTEAAMGAIREVATWLKVGDLYAFDTWIANVDRHAGNLLVGGEDEVWLIDHGYSYTGPNWQPSSLNAQQPYRNRLSEWLTAQLAENEKDKCEQSIHEFQTEIDGADLEQRITESRIGGLLPSGDTNALHEFLMDRVDHIPKIACAALGRSKLI